jgi:hypothetical protein
MVHLSLSTEALLGQVVVVSTITTMKFANSNKICRKAEPFLVTVVYMEG